MTAFIKVRNVGLELMQDLQREGGRPASLLASLSGTERRYATLLSGIDFEAREGDRIGLIGLNGAGKTTLLRVLNGAFLPSSGHVDMRGTRLSLLNPTLGFEERATVIENVFLRGTAMGLRKRQIEPVLEDILDFAGLADRGHFRLHHLSTGQRARLGFAISTAVQPDILLMDEWIITGDAAFIERARERMLGRFRDSRIVVLASHSTALLRELCNKALVLDQGRMRFYGDIGEGLEVYREIVERANTDLRRELANADPLLFGDCRGVIERIRTTGSLVEIQGWAEDGKGGEVGVICVELDGQVEMFEQFERLDREDVRLHLGRRHGRYGFRLRLDYGVAPSPETLVTRIKVSAGLSRQRLGAPLPVARGGIIEMCYSACDTTS